MESMGSQRVRHNSAAENNDGSSSNPRTGHGPRCKTGWRRPRHLSADFPALPCIPQSVEECPPARGPGVSRRVLDTKAHSCLGHADNMWVCTEETTSR